MENLKKRKIFTISLLLAVAALHLIRVGQYLPGGLSNLYGAYFSDIALPFCMYFLLSISNIKLSILGKWQAKAAIVFAAASFCELMQYMDIYFLGITFDPLDFLMYGIGAALAICVERVLFGGKEESI